ncbi:MAG: hypothetical protein RL605_663 [Actinomycetota bacterium]
MLKFVLVRLGVFALIFAIMLVLQFDPFFAAVVAAVLGLAISLIFFNKQRNQVSEAVYEWTKRKGDKDSAAEDATAEDAATDEAAEDAAGNN